ncbi:MAG: hypothetical protein RI955_971 [Bacteroidota bacterium]|jgi:hypothetical protein
MKIKNYIATLLATYLFALMLLPCNNTCCLDEHETPTTTQATQNHHETDTDICSPFCFCSCCATAIIALHNPDFNFVPHYSLQTFSLLEQVFLSKKHSAIWQPPKLG